MWGEAVKAASYLKNCTPTRMLVDKTPYKMWYGRCPNVSHLRELVCKVWVHIPGDNPKIYNRSIECVLVGYSENSKTYCCLERSSGRIHVSRNVLFTESQDLRERPLHPGLTIDGIDADTDDAPRRHDTHSTTCLVHAEEPGPELPETTLRRSARIAKTSKDTLGGKSSAYTQFPDDEVQPTNFSLPDDTGAHAEAGAYMESEVHMPEEYVHFTYDDKEWCNLNDEDDAISYRDAFLRPDAPQWQAAYEDEMKSLRKHKVWDLIPHMQIPAGRKVIPSKPVFHYKWDSNGNIIRHKVRVVAKGFAQKPGIDYTETYAPVPRMESTQVLLHIGASLDWEIHQMDVKTAFLHGDLEEEVSMEQPEGMKERGKEDWVCYMRKTLYGLMKAARAWNICLHHAMLEIGYVHISADHCIYMRNTTSGSSIVAIHVDDMAAAASNKAEMAKLKEQLGNFFGLLDLGELKWLLGMAVTRNRRTRTISLSQAAYIESIAKHLHLEDTHPVTTPLDPHVILSKDHGPKDEEGKLRMKKILYLTTIGSIMYAATATHPDVSYAVQHLSQFNSNPGYSHWTAAQCVIRYLYATRDRSLVLGGPDIRLTGWVDSDWGACTDTRRSISGYAFSLGSGLVSWSSKKQPTVATSSTEAEYIASCHGAKEAVWLRSLLKSLGHAQDRASCIHCDNVRSNILTRDPSFHTCSKHIDIQHHYVRERVEAGDIHYAYIPTHDNIADCLTNLFHTQNSKNSWLIWACATTFQLEGGFWKWASGNGHYHQQVMGPCGHIYTPQSFNSYFE